MNQQQEIEDKVNLDYAAWSDRQRRAGKTTDHGEWQRVRSATLERQRQENAELRKRHEKKIEADRKAQAEKRQQEAEAALKSRLKAAYLNNPAATPEDFEKDYPTLRSDYLKQEAASKEADARRRSQELARQYF